MTVEKSTFEPDEIDVMKYILNHVYRKLDYMFGEGRYRDSNSEIEVTTEEYVALESVLGKFGITLY